MTTLWVALLVTVVLAVLAAVVIFAILYRAVSNVIDWITTTFGNPGSGKSEIGDPYTDKHG